MKVKITLLQVVLIVLGLLTATFFVGRCSTLNERDRVSKSLISAQNTLKTQAKIYQVYIDGQKETIAEQKTVIMNKDIAIRSEIISKEKYKALHLKSVRENIKLLGEVNILKDSLKVKPDTIYQHDTIHVDTSTYLKLPTGFHYTDKYVTLNTNINKDLTWGFDLSLPLNVDITLGNKKAGWFKSQPTILVQPNNPYVSNIKIQDIKIEGSESFWRSNTFKAITHGLSFAAGYYLGGR